MIAKGYRIFLVVLLAATTARGLFLTRGPYIGRPNDTDVAISWRTDVASDSRVDFAPLDSDAWTTMRDTNAVTMHSIRIEGLVPGEMYRYQIFSNDLPLSEATFRAPRDRSQSEFRFAVIGDTNTRDVPRMIAAELTVHDPDFAIHTGDVVYPVGGDDMYDDEYFQPMAAFVRQAAVLPTLGNHDVLTNRGEPFLTNFVLPGSRFYAFRHASALFVCLDVETSSFGKGSLQYNWLIRTLTESDATWTFVYFHEPPYSSDVSDAVARIVLGPLFEHYGVDIVFSGHAHLYERTYPIRGVVYVTEGGAGAAFSAFHRQKFSAVVSATHGYMIGSIAGGQLSMTRYGVDGAIIDEFSIEK